jgi:RNA polymerase sigma-70 factor (ECF subfamily)
MLHPVAQIGEKNTNFAKPKVTWEGQRLLSLREHGVSNFADNLGRGRKGDRHALEGLFAPWRALLRLQADQLLGAELAARIDPSDVVQEAYTYAFANLDQFRGTSEGEWVNWLRAIVAGQAANARRHHQAQKRALDREQPPCPAPADGNPGPTSALLLKEQDAQLASAIAALPADMHAVVVRRVFHQEPFESIAADLGRSSGAARVLWTRALRRLKQLLGEA